MRCGGSRAVFTKHMRKETASGSWILLISKPDILVINND